MMTCTIRCRLPIVAVVALCILGSSSRAFADFRGPVYRSAISAAERETRAQLLVNSSSQTKNDPWLWLERHPTVVYLILFGAAAGVGAAAGAASYDKDKPEGSRGATALRGAAIGGGAMGAILLRCLAGC
jgi:hypothetical protein